MSIRRPDRAGAPGRTGARTTGAFGAGRAAGEGGALLRHPDAESLLRRVLDIVDNAKSLPLSTSVVISREEVLELLEEALERLPEEVRQGRWMVRERQEFLARTEREGEEILEAARTRAERMVQRSEIVRQARHVAQQTVEQAREEARRLRHEADDYCDQKLAAFEVVLRRTTRAVQAGRAKLGTSSSMGEQAPVVAEAREEAVFDQDGVRRP